MQKALVKGFKFLLVGNKILKIVKKYATDDKIKGSLFGIYNALLV